MATYTTLDQYPDLSAVQMASAPVLSWAVSAPNSLGGDFEAVSSGSTAGASLRSIFRFTAIEGATYSLSSLSALDPLSLRVYDQFGNTIVVNNESDDPAGSTFSDGYLYQWDQIPTWRAPYTGTYYVDASWLQSSSVLFHFLMLTEDRDTAATNRAPLVASALRDQNWTEGRLLFFEVPEPTFSDPDAQALTLTASLASGAALPSWLGFDPARRRFEGIAPPGGPDLTVRVTATDPLGASVFDDVVFFTVAGASNGITGTAGADKLVGTTGDDTLYGLAGNDSLDGGAGNDTLIGGDGDDTFDWDPDQRAGNDRFEGGAGNDTFVLSGTGDTVVENAGAGTDVIWTPVSYSLASAANVENLLGFGSVGLTLTGNALDNFLQGTAANDRLTGGVGNDRIDGKGGQDVAVFSGNFSDYTITFDSATGSYRVADRQAGRDGIDTVLGVETLSFADGQRAVSSTGGDTTPPFVLAYTPADEAQGVDVTTNITIIFSEPVVGGSGNIVLRTGSGVLVESFAVASSTNLQFGGSTLTINPRADLSPGTAYRLDLPQGSIRDAAGNSFAGASDYNFTTRVFDDYAADVSTTGRASISGEVTGTVEFAGDADWFVVNLTAGRRYQFALNGQTLADPFLAIHDARGNRLATDDDTGPGLNALLAYVPPVSGTYYLSASGVGANLGTYSLGAVLLAGDDYAGNRLTTGRIVLDGASIRGTVETANDEDWFSVTLEAGQAYTFRLDGETLSDPVVGIFSGSGQFIALDDNSGGQRNALLGFTATTTGTHYVAATGVGGTVGTYSLTAKRVIGDDQLASTATTGRLAVGSSIDGNIERVGDHDWFAIPLVAGQNVQFNLEGTTLADPLLTLRSSSGAAIASDDDSGTGLNARLTYRVPSSGTYYVDVQGVENTLGTYRLSAAAVAADDVGDGPSTTARVVVGGSFSGGIDFAGDEDWVAVSLSAGQSYAFRLDGVTLSDPLLGLFSSAGVLLDIDDDSGGSTNSLIQFVPTATGTYFLAAAGYGSATGSYRLSVSGAVNDDFAGTAGTTGRVGIGGSTSGRIESANDSDWFAVSLTAGQAYQFRLRGAGGSDPQLSLLSGSGTVLATDDDSGGGLDSLIRFTATATGTHFLAARMQGTTTGDYTVSAETAAAADSGYSIRIAYSGDARYRTYFDQAVARWTQVIVGDLPDVRDSTYGLIDDLLIEARVSTIDGPGGILGRAAPTARRAAEDSWLPYRGFMEFDSADLAGMEADGTLASVILHEMGHVLGINSTDWPRHGLVSADRSTYIGPAGVAAYRQLTGNVSLRSVPVETDGGAGTAFGHWDEQTFDRELMTGFAESAPPMPLSILTVGTLADLGYQVNYGAADPFGL